MVDEKVGLRAVVRVVVRVALMELLMVASTVAY